MIKLLFLGHLIFWSMIWVIPQPLKIFLLVLLAIASIPFLMFLTFEHRRPGHGERRS